jgi:hypothetical protein
MLKNLPKTHLLAAAVLAGILLPPQARAASPEVAAAETTISIYLSGMHTQYHENLGPPTDDESGATPGFGVALGGLTPYGATTDLYTSLNYNFSAGPINYNGFTQPGDQPLAATDNAVFNRIEARIGVGLPLANGAEAIPFLAGGYQAWNRNVDSKITIDGGEFYHTFLFGAGLKFDQPVTPAIVLSATAEGLGLAGGNVQNNGIGFGRGMGVTAEELISLGLDYAMTPRWHTFGSIYWEHFIYSGTHPEYFSDGYAYEPLSTTTQFGVNAGVGFSFNE